MLSSNKTWTGKMVWFIMFRSFSLYCSPSILTMAAWATSGFPRGRVRWIQAWPYFRNSNGNPLGNTTSCSYCLAPGLDLMGLYPPFGTAYRNSNCSGATTRVITVMSPRFKYWSKYKTYHVGRSSQESPHPIP